MKHIILLCVYALSVSALVTACTVDDDDRCTDQYEWNADQAACITPPEPVDTVPSDTDTTPAFLGSACRGEVECADGGDFTYCLMDPLNAAADGMCTVIDCTADDCEGDFACCNCSASPLAFLSDWPGALCVDAGSAADAASLGGCTCE